MTKLEQIEKSVAELSKEELKAFAKWFAELQADLWDRQIEADAKAGRLDKLAEKALADHKRPDAPPLTHHAAPEFWDAYQNLPATVRRQADRTFAKLKSDQYHPSVHFKQVGRYWSARVGLHYRAVALRDENEFIWFWIGTHAEYDKLLRYDRYRTAVRVNRLNMLQE